MFIWKICLPHKLGYGRLLSRRFEYFPFFKVKLFSRLWVFFLFLTVVVKLVNRGMMFGCWNCVAYIGGTVDLEMSSASGYPSSTPTSNQSQVQLCADICIWITETWTLPLWTPSSGSLLVRSNWHVFEILHHHPTSPKSHCQIHAFKITRNND